MSVSHKARIVWVIATIVVAVGLVGVVLWLTVFRGAAPESESSENTGAISEYSSVMSEAEGAIEQGGDADAARAVYDKALEGAADNDKKGDILNLKAVTLGDAGYYEDALEAAWQAEGYYTDPSKKADALMTIVSYGELGELYGDAAKALRQLIDLIRVTPALSEQLDIEEYEQRLKDLGDDV